MNEMLRQGDVLLRRVEVLPEGLRPVKRDRGRVVLAYGEVTGHAHAIADRDVELYEAGSTAAAVERYLRVGAGGATLAHEEHGHIALAPNTTYQVFSQYEYAPVEVRRVAD